MVPRSYKLKREEVVQELSMHELLFKNPYYTYIGPFGESQKVLHEEFHLVGPGVVFCKDMKSLKSSSILGINVVAVTYVLYMALAELPNILNKIKLKVEVDKLRGNLKLKGITSLPSSLETALVELLAESAATAEVSL